ncbi:RimK family alpha-L-glutamate ligase [Candidatus Woesearchaeota archaeon]|nr:RimK family alpha-L-glutamate ligase [Candidatus Woesearchaeota archaeon]
MKAALISLGSRSSLMILNEMQNYFESVANIDVRDLEVKLGNGRLEVLYDGKPLPQYDCIYTRGSFRYAPLLRSITMTLSGTAYMPIRADAYTIGHDKLLSHLTLQHFSIPMPTTYLASSPKAAKKILHEINYPIVLKFPKGTQGKGVMFAESFAAASSMLDALFALRQPFLIQEYIETGGNDIRALVAGDKVIASMRRHAERGELRANIHAGGYGESCELNEDTKRIAVMTAKSLGIDICAVDMLESPKGPLVIEPNLSPGIRGISKATGQNVAESIAKFLSEKTQEFKEISTDKATTELLEDLGITDKPVINQIITNLDFRASRILLPKIATDMSHLSSSDEAVIKIENGKIVVEKM